MKSPPLYIIKNVAHLTGLPPHLIRAWERRYAAVSPQRSNGNRRIYRDGDIVRLKLLKKVVSRGHNISQVANLSHEELRGLIASGSSETRVNKIEVKTDLLSAGYFYNNALRYVVELDASGLQATLDKAAVSLSRMALILDVIHPLSTKSQELVDTGKLRHVSLNVATIILQTYLWEMLRTAVVSESAPKMVIAAPTGQRSDIAALALALIGVESGWRSIYFGPNLPAHEIAAAVIPIRPQLLALSFSHFGDKDGVEKKLIKIRDELIRSVKIIACSNGQFSMAYLDQIDGIVSTKLKNFRRELDSLSSANN